MAPAGPPGDRLPSTAQCLALLEQAHALACQAQAQGRHPFAALLVAPDHQTVLLTQGNLGPVRHAEATLARRAAQRFDRVLLWRCTLVSTVEPCAMCTATQYWAHIGGLVFGLAERQLLAITGAHPDNPTLDLPCREVLARGQKDIQVAGPFDALAPRFSALHRSFWSR